METYFYSCFIHNEFAIETGTLKINSAIPHGAMFCMFEFPFCHWTGFFNYSPSAVFIWRMAHSGVIISWRLFQSAIEKITLKKSSKSKMLPYQNQLKKMAGFN